MWLCSPWKIDSNPLSSARTETSVIDGVVSLRAVTIPMCMFGNIRDLDAVRHAPALDGGLRARPPADQPRVFRRRRGHRPHRLARGEPGRRAVADLASLTHGHEEHRPDLPAGNRTDVDIDVIRGWWSLRSLRKSR